MKVFGPVPSRRLGQSLGINNIPFKHCTYSCVYCQLGRTNNMQIKREKFYDPKELFNEAEIKINNVKKSGDKIDFLTFVTDGEPTLDINLGLEIELLKTLGIKIAVITNASLLWDDNVKNDLMLADYVSVKVDSLNDKIWSKIDRPYGQLKLDKILQGIKDFSKMYKGTLIAETMLVNGINDSLDDINKLSEFLSEINPNTLYILTPTRPPAEDNVNFPEGDKIKIFFDKINTLTSFDVQCITGDEGDSFFVKDDIEGDLLSIMSVHPIKEEALKKILDRKSIGYRVIENLIKQNLIKKYKYKDDVFYIKIH